jgi:lipopolysaccharide export system protein LptC
MVFDTEQLEYRTGAGLILTDRPVKVVDGRLTLTARSMEMTLSDEQVRFMGTVNAVIEGYHAKR